jgi:hypothetical protein
MKLRRNTLIPTGSEFTQNSILLKSSVVIVKFHFQNGPITKLKSYISTDLYSSLVTKNKKAFPIAILHNNPKCLNIVEYPGNFNKRNVTLSYQIDVY